jgi:hypothetical protein
MAYEHAQQSSLRCAANMPASAHAKAHALLPSPLDVYATTDTGSSRNASHPGRLLVHADRAQLPAGEKKPMPTGCTVSRLQYWSIPQALGSHTARTRSRWAPKVAKRRRRHGRTAGMVFLAEFVWFVDAFGGHKTEPQTRNFGRIAEIRFENSTRVPVAGALI